jgi:trigger factor
MKIDDFSRNIQAQGLSIDQYLQYMGQDIEAMKAAYRPMSTKQVKARLALEAVAKAENLEASEDEIMAEVEKIAKTYGMEADKLKEVLRPEDRENIAKDVKVQNALKFIAENGVAEKAE